MGLKRVKIEINGIVQGVGFRPFIHKLTEEYGLCGWIRNTAAGVELDIEGDGEGVAHFVGDITEKSPKLSVIESVKVEEMSEIKGYSGFEIIKSLGSDRKNTLISPDVCICEDCLKELFDRKNRRYRYPFINCTNCGPRFTIIKDVPYDRAKTTMLPFEMCEKCATEYGSIYDRRYHAQPNCCETCGPELMFLNKDGNRIEGDAIALAQSYIKEGKIVAVKGLGGIHLACRADDADLVMELRRRKHRDEKPFALMCRDTEAARRFCEISGDEEKILTGFRRPIVLLKKRDGKNSLRHISENGYVGIMLPYTPVHYLIMQDGIESLVMTSANLSDLPIIYKNDEAVENLHGIADGFLLNNREIHVRCDDSLMWVVDGKEYFVRRSRGYAPFPVNVPKCSGDILACGAEQKASFSLSKGSCIFPSQHIGDLKNIETFENYSRQIEHFQRLFDIKPEKIVCDMHPDYMSSSYAKERAERERLPLYLVQHHFAHMASCMADNGLDEKCIGVVWDGTGYGTDETVWGGEFLLGDYTGFERKGTLKRFSLPGGDRATKELWRVGCALLHSAEIGGVFPPEQEKTVSTMIENSLNCPETTSMGRLFDGVSAILGIKIAASYEGQGAVLLESAVADTDACYDANIIKKNGLYVFDYTNMVKSLVKDKENGINIEILASKFMNTVISAAAEICAAISADTGVKKVVMSGGVFQNMYVLKRLMKKLEKSGLDAYHHVRVSTNDEGISLGQIMIAEKGGGVYVPCSTTENS